MPGFFKSLGSTFNKVSQQAGEITAGAQQAGNGIAAGAQQVAQQAAKAGTELASNVHNLTTAAAVSVEMAHVEQQIENLKAAWGKAHFDLAIAGSYASMTDSTASFKAERERLGAKLATLRARKAALTGQPEPGSTTTPDSSVPTSVATPVPALDEVTPMAQPMLSVTIPPGAVPGTVLCGLVDGQLYNVTVPPGATPGMRSCPRHPPR